MKGKTLIFDFDGTLVDSMPVWSGVMLKILEANNVSYPSDIIKIITPLGYKGTAEYFISVLGLKKDVESTVARMHELAIEEYSTKVFAKETVAETLKILKDRGYSLNVLTASPHPSLDPCLKNNGIYDIFDNVWSCDDFNTSKSDVRIYYEVAKKLGVSVEDCVFLDDNANADRVAKSSGMLVIGVYDDSSKEFENEIRLVCDEYIYKFSQLLNFLEPKC